MQNKQLLLTRYGGAIQIFLEEVSASNTASLDYYMIKLLGEAGNHFHIYGNLSKTGEKILALGEDPICKFITYHPDSEILSTVPDFIDMVLCIQGTENYRFGGPHGVPSQVWFYRLLRSSKVPFIYMQYDAYCKLFLPPSIRGKESAIWGATDEEAKAANITILHAGKDSQWMKDNSYAGLPVEVMGWDIDIHAHAVISLRSALRANLAPANTIAFVGKHRRFGSRSDEILRLATKMETDTYMDQEGYKFMLYGNWSGLFGYNVTRGMIENGVKEDGTVDPALLPYNSVLQLGGVLKGSDAVRKAYNMSRYAILAGNDAYRSLKQYTVRVFEVLAAGTLPLFEKEWYEGWKNIFTPEVQGFIDANLVYEKVEDIPALVCKIDKEYDRAMVIMTLQSSLLTNLSPERILNLWSNLYILASQYEYQDVDCTQEVIDASQDVEQFKSAYIGSQVSDHDFCLNKLRR